MAQHQIGHCRNCIGLASARRLLDEGACVVLTDIDREPLDEAVKQLQAQYGEDSSVGFWSDVTDEAAIAALFREAARHFGGIDICVSNAGIASAAAIGETTLAIWRRNMDILSTGYFLVSRECVRLMNAQNLGGAPAGTQRAVDLDDKSPARAVLQ